MKPETYNLKLTENEVIAIERALEFSKANSTIQKDLLGAFFTAEIGNAAHSAYKKIGKLHRDIQIAVGRRREDEDAW